MHVDPHLAPRLMEVQIGFDCEALHLSSTLTRTDVQWDWVVSSGLESPVPLVCVCARVHVLMRPVLSSRSPKLKVQPGIRLKPTS